jgi:serine/threonine protein kinase
MEYCSGGDLSNFLKNNENITNEIKENFILDLVNGMSYLNKNEIIHRDLKPQNILLINENEKNLKISDFGFAKSLKGTIIKIFKFKNHK